MLLDFVFAKLAHKEKGMAAGKESLELVARCPNCRAFVVPHCPMCRGTLVEIPVPDPDPKKVQDQDRAVDNLVDLLEWPQDTSQ